MYDFLNHIVLISLKLQFSKKKKNNYKDLIDDTKCVPIIDGIIYLKTNPKNCLEFCNKREDKKESKNIPIEYLQ